MTYQETDQGGLLFGSGEPPADPSEKSRWELCEIAGRWWLEREVVTLARQVSAGEGIVHQFCNRRLERLGPFEDLAAASGYQAAMEGR